MPQPIRQTAVGLDLSPRIQVVNTSPANLSSATEGVILTLTIAGFGDLSVVSGILVTGFVALTLAGSSTAIRFRIRQTNSSGTAVADTGACTAGVAGAALIAQDVEGFDSGAGVGVYVLTGQTTAGSGTSTVSAASLRAIVI